MTEETDQLPSISHVETCPPGDYEPTSIIAGCTEGELSESWASLSPTKQALLLKIMAQIHELGYKRGVTHGADPELRDDPDFPKDLLSWRYDAPLDRCIGLDGFETSAQSRLYMEVGDELAEVGISWPEEAEEQLERWLR